MNTISIRCPNCNSGDVHCVFTSQDRKPNGRFRSYGQPHMFVFCRNYECRQAFRFSLTSGAFKRDQKMEWHSRPDLVIA